MDKIQQLVTSYKKQKITFILMGGGAELAGIIKYPGASALINNIFIPYNSPDFLSAYDIEYNKIVSQETNNRIIEAFRDNNDITVVVNASLTTNRIRKGVNEAFISIDIPGKSTIHKHLIFDKFTEEQSYQIFFAKRSQEDSEIFDFVINTLKEYNETN
jgi:hypothetical protein